MSAIKATPPAVSFNLDGNNSVKSKTPTETIAASVGLTSVGLASVGAKQKEASDYCRPVADNSVSTHRVLTVASSAVENDRAIRDIEMLDTMQPIAISHTTSIPI